MKDKIIMTIYVHIKTNYGKDSYYVNDPDMAKAISTLTKKVTVDVNDINALKALGFTVQLKQPTLTTML